MKALLIPALTTVALSFNAAAALNSVKFVGVDQTETTKLCLIAAQDGYQSAVAYAEANGIARGEAKRTVCNGDKLQTFARKYQIAEMAKPVKVIAGNQATESQICVEAVKFSLSYVVDQYGDIDNVICNGRKIENFVKRYQG